MKEDFINKLLRQSNQALFPIPINVEIKIKERHSTEIALEKVQKIETTLDALLLLFPSFKIQLDEIRKTALIILTDETYVNSREKTNTLRLLLKRLDIVHKIAQNQPKEFNWLSFLRITPINMPNENAHTEIGLEKLTEILIEALKTNQSLKIVCLTDLSIGALSLHHPSSFCPSLNNFLEVLKGKKHISNLQIQNNNLTEDDLGYLAKFIQDTPIRYLNISNNKLQEDSIKYIQNALIHNVMTPMPQSENVFLFIEALKKHRQLIYLSWPIEKQDIDKNDFVCQDPKINAYFKPNIFYTAILEKRGNDPQANIDGDLAKFLLALESAHWDEERKTFIITELVESLMELEGSPFFCPIAIEQYKSNLQLPFSLEIHWLIQVGLKESFLKRIIYLHHPDHLVAMIRRLYAPTGDLFLSISPEAEKLLLASPTLCVLTEKEAEAYQKMLSTLFPNFKNFDLKDPESFQNFFKSIIYFINQEKGHYSLNFFGKAPMEMNIWMTLLGPRYTLLKSGIIPLPEWERKNNQTDVYQTLKDSLDFEIENLSLKN